MLIVRALISNDSTTWPVVPAANSAGRYWAHFHEPQPLATPLTNELHGFVGDIRTLIGDVRTSVCIPIVRYITLKVVEAGNV